MEKEVQIVNLNQKVVSYLDKTSGQQKSFILYQIQGNDGITYETGDAKQFGTYAVGQTVKLKYTIQSRQKGSKIYTSYRLENAAASKLGANTSELLEALRKLYTRVEQAEKNIIAAIELKDVKVLDEVDIPVINEELSVIKEAEVEQGNEDGLPF